MAISESKKKIVIDNYFKRECDVNTSIKEAFTKGFELGLKKTLTPQQTEWIPVSERLPKDDGEYLATIYDTDENYKYMDIAELENGIWQYKDYIKVLAWMPLPKPYEPQENQCTDCNHYGKFSLDCGRCDDDCSMFEPQERSDKE